MSEYAIAWSGLPCYGARLVRAGIDLLGEPVEILGTRPGVPAKGMDAIVGQQITWLGREDRASWSRLGLEVPRVFFFTGWATPVFRRLAQEVKRAGGTTVGMIDNNYRRDLRQMAGGVYFRLYLRGLYDYVWVPGHSGARLAITLGFPKPRIALGQYSADTTLPQSAPPMTDRPRRFLFVGQFIDRKNTHLLCQAFLTAFGDMQDPPELVLVGSGPLREHLPAHPQIIIESFSSPARVREWMAMSRWFVLPSKRDHWPLVVHEAVLSGCMLLLSDAIGSITEFASEDNSRIVPTNDCAALAKAFRDLASLPDTTLEVGRLKSLSLARKRSVEQWAQTFVSFCRGHGVAEQARIA